MWHMRTFSRKLKALVSTQNNRQNNNNNKTTTSHSLAPVLFLLLFFTWRHCGVHTAGTAHLWRMGQGPNLQGLHHPLDIYFPKVKSLPALELPRMLVNTLWISHYRNSTQTVLSEKALAHIIEVKGRSFGWSGPKELKKYCLPSPPCSLALTLFLSFFPFCWLHSWEGSLPEVIAFSLSELIFIPRRGSD